MKSRARTDGATGAPVAEDVAKELDALSERLAAAAATNIGFPATADFDYSALAPFFARYMLNNLGDPYSNGAYPMHTKPMEREVVDTVADLFGAPVGDRWGYVAGGATEGTEYALHLASTLHTDAVVYHSTSAHHAVTNVIQRLGLTAVPIRADALGEIDYDDLAEQVNLRRHVSAIVVANIGSAVTEAVDDVPRIVQVLDRCAVRRRWIHGDAALSGIPLALLDPDERPAIDFSAGIDSIVTSGHKFLGSPVPSAVVVVRNSHRLAHVRAVTYTGSPDTTVGNSRSGLAALVLWYALRTHGLDGLRARAEQSRQLAAATHDALREIGWPAHRHKHAMSVSFPTPPASVTAKWVLATHGDTSLIVCMPGVTAEQIDAFVADLRAAITADAATAATSELPALSNGATATVPAQPGPRDFTVAPNGAPAAPSGGSGATPLPTIRQSRPPVAAPSPAAAPNPAAPNPAAPNPAAPNPAAANPAAANPAAASAGAPADTGAVEVRPDTAPAAAAPPPMGPLLPTPPQSLQRRKMLRRAGMSIRL